MDGKTLARHVFFGVRKLILGSRDTELMVNQTFGEFLVIPKCVRVFAAKKIVDADFLTCIINNETANNTPKHEPQYI